MRHGGTKFAVTMMAGILATAGALVLGGGVASATGNGGISGGVLTFSGGSENNSVSLAVSGSSYTLTDFGAGSVTAGSGCVASNGPAGPMPILTCNRAGVTAIVIRTNDGEDTAQVSVGNTVPAGVSLTVELGAGNDSWSGQNGPETVSGGGGNDSIDLWGGDDEARGGPGRDTIHGRDGDDELFGDGGTDFLYGEGDDDTLDGGEGTDEVRGSVGTDNVRGGADNDTVGGGLGADRVQGDGGNDLLFDDDRPLQDAPFQSPDVLVGGTGNSIALQMVSVTGQVGLNVAAGGAALTLTPVGR